MKFLQLLGNLSPLFIALLAYSLFGDIEPELPSYITALLIVFSALGIGPFFIFTIPSSVLLLKLVISINHQLAIYWVNRLVYIGVYYYFVV